MNRKLAVLLMIAVFAMMVVGVLKGSHMPTGFAVDEVISENLAPVWVSNTTTFVIGADTQLVLDLNDYFVDPEGLVRLMIYYPQEIGRQVDEVLRSLKALQTADTNACAMPENWPNNELLGSKVINPPPKDVKTAEERLKSSEGYDWWFTYRDLK